MVDQLLLGRVLKDAMKGGKFTIGTKEVLSDVKTFKVVLAASTLSGDIGKKLASEAEANKVPIVKLDKSSSQLGGLVGRPYKVSAVGLRTVSERDLTELTAKK